MDNERKVFNVEEEPIGIKPLEGATPEVEQSDEIKLVRENPVEPEAKPEVKVVNTKDFIIEVRTRLEKLL